MIIAAINLMVTLPIPSMICHYVPTGAKRTAPLLKAGISDIFIHTMYGWKILDCRDIKAIRFVVSHNVFPLRWRGYIEYIPKRFRWRVGSRGWNLPPRCVHLITICLIVRASLSISSGRTGQGAADTWNWPAARAGGVKLIGAGREWT